MRRAFRWCARTARPVQLCEVPTINVTNLAGFGNGGPTLFVQNNYEWRDTLTWNKGSHSFKAGFDLFKLQSNFDPTRGYQRPEFTFNTPGDLRFRQRRSEPQTNIGFNPVDRLAVCRQCRRAAARPPAFVQDNWKVKSNLSVTLGLRWETSEK